MTSLHQHSLSLAAILQALDSACPPAVLAPLAGWHMDTVRRALDDLRRHGHLRTMPEGKVRLCRSAELGTRLETALACLSAEDADGTFLEHLRLKAAGRTLAALAALSRLGQDLAVDGAIDAAMLVCDLLQSELLRVRLRTAADDEAMAYVAICLDLPLLTLHLPHEADTLVKILFRARSVAYGLGDQRSQALLDLMIGATNSRTYTRHNSPHLHAVMSRGAKALEGFGDRETLIRAAPWLGTYNFMEGRYQRAIDNFTLALQSHSGWAARHVEEMYIRYVSSAAAFLGDFHLAVGILRANVHNASMKGHCPTTRMVRAQLATMLLVMGELSEGLEQLDAALTGLSRRLEPINWLWITSILAHYHVLCGRVATSHAIMHECLAAARDMGYTRPVYLSPGFLETLHAYEREGLPQLPIYDLNEELARCIAGPNRMLQAVALRLTGQRLIERGPRFVTEALAAFERSLDILRALNAPNEGSKTCIALATLHLCLHNRDQAQVYALEAWPMFERLKQQSWPSELASLLPDPRRAEAPPARLTTEALYERYMQAMIQDREWNTIGEYLAGMVETSCAEFGAARGAIFQRQEGMPPRLVAGRQVTEEIVASRAFAVSLDLIHAAIANRPVLAVVGSGGLPDGGDVSTILACIPIDCGPDGHYVLYHDSWLLAEVAELLSEELLARLGKGLAREFSIAHRLYRRLENRLRTAPKGEVDEALTEVQYQSQVMCNFMMRVDIAAESGSSVLILGESGVGKELVARRIHALSARPGRFVAVNLSSTPEELFESELYGHEKGAFTGAHQQKPGLFELAHGGTLFIDEFGDISPRMQVKLLRVLQEHSFMRLGGTRLIHSDFRLIAATNRDLAAKIRDGSFREDLYYRICVIPLHVPPLREREGDVVHIARYYLNHFARRHNRKIPAELAPEDVALLKSYPWPGNVRELKNVIERAVILSDGTKLKFYIEPTTPVAGAAPPANAPAAMPTAAPQPFLFAQSTPDRPPTAGEVLKAYFASLPTAEDVLRGYIAMVLKMTDGRIDGETGAARILGLKRSTLYEKIRRYKLRGDALG